MASKSTSSTHPIIIMIDDLEMSLEFGPPRQLPDRSNISVTTEEKVIPQPKIKLFGPPSSWPGPPSLGAGMSRATCIVSPQIDSSALMSTIQPHSNAKTKKDTGSNKNAAGPGRRSALSNGHGGKRRRDSESAEHKPAKAPKVACTRKKNNRRAQKAGKKAEKKAVKKLSDLSIE